MEPSPHLLIVEDDREIRDLVARFLAKHGFRVSTPEDARAMDRVLEVGRIDLIVLDLMLPGGEDGIAVCRRLRVTSNVPIIMLTALAEDTDRIVGLEVGADDYVTKPFNPRELLARIRAVLRRGAGAAHGGLAIEKPTVLAFGNWRLDVGLRQLRSADGVRVALTGGEFDLLLAFCQHPRRVLTRDQLLDLTHGRATGVFDRSVDIQVSRLRRKIELNPREPQLIQTVRSGGYLFTPDVSST